MKALKKGDFFVPTGGSYPADMWEVHDDAGPDRLSIVPASGGLVITVARSEIRRKGFRKVDPKTEPKQLRRARFALGHDNYEKAHPGYTFGDLWNGFDCPYFDRASADSIMLDMPGMTYDSENDAYTISAEALGYEPEDEPEVFPAERIPGVDAPVYGIGRGGWCWEEVAPPAKCSK